MRDPLRDRTAVLRPGPAAAQQEHQAVDALAGGEAAARIGSVEQAGDVSFSIASSSGVLMFPFSL